VSLHDDMRAIKLAIDSNADGKRPLEGKPFLQHKLCLIAKEAALSLQEESRKKLYRDLGKALDRARRSPAPEEMAEKIIALSSAKILDALRYDEREAEKFHILPEEEVYPMDQSTWLGRFMLWSRHGNSPLGYHAWSGISALGATCQRRVYFPAARHIWMNMYIILGGDRSTGKGQGFDNAMEVLDLVNAQLNADIQPGMNTPLDKIIRIIPPDSTQEAIITSLAGGTTRGGFELGEEDEDGAADVHMLGGERIDATGILALDEMATWFGKGAWGADKRGAFLTQIKESDSYSKDTKISGLENLQNLAFSLLACCAPGWMGSAIDSDMLGSGFKDRCMWIHRGPIWMRRYERSIITALPTDPIEANYLAQWLRENILDMRFQAPAMIQPKAQEEMQSFYLSEVSREEKDFKIFGTSGDANSSNRLLWALAQVATLLAVSRGGFQLQLDVTIQDVEQAIAIINVEMQSMALFMEEANKDKSVNVEQAMLGYLPGVGGCCMMSLFNRRFRNYGPPAVIRRFVGNLVDQGLADVKVRPGRGDYVRLIDHACEKCES